MGYEDLVEILTRYVKTVEKPKELSLDVNNLWRWLVEQICVRASSASIQRLIHNRRGDEFHSQLSLKKMPLSCDAIIECVRKIQNWAVQRRAFQNHSQKLLQLL